MAIDTLPAKYSIYFNPAEGSPTHALTNQVIKELAERFQAPVFDFHVTALPDVAQSQAEVLSKVAQLASQLQSFKIDFNMFAYTDGLYQTLVLKAVHTSKLMGANRALRDAFNRHDDPLYNPHGSLLYKTGISNEVKESLIKELQPRLLPGPEQLLSFTADKLYVYTSVPRIEDWKRVGEFRLGQ